MLSRLAGRDEEWQLSTLLHVYCLGEDAEDILDTKRITAEDKKKCDTVVEAFDNYFKVCKILSLREPILIRGTNGPMNHSNSSSLKYTR